MRNKFKITNKIKYLIIVLICFILIGLSFVTDKGPTILRTAASYTVVPVQKGISGVSNYIASHIGKFDSYKDLQAENESLKEQIENLKQENVNLAQDQTELKKLQGIYNLDKYYSNYETIGASVIGKGDDSWFSTFTIDKGSKDGIKKDMNVIAHGGLVGIVTSVGPHYATIRSAIDDSSNISGQDSATNDYCIVKGDSTLITENRIYFDQMDNSDSEVQVGDKIYTSDISSKFLPGLLIGTIAEVKVSSNNLTRYGYITPAVDFSDIKEVLIIKNTKSNQ